jgi:hypothetical protein
LHLKRRNPALSSSNKQKAGNVDLGENK